MNTEKCNCNQTSDRYCDICKTPLCDDCDKGDWNDQCSLCESCKDYKTDEYNEQRRISCERDEKMLKVIQENKKLITDHWSKDISGKTMYLKKAFSVLSFFDWELWPVFVGEENARKKRMQEMIRKDIDHITALSEIALKANNVSF